MRLPIDGEASAGATFPPKPRRGLQHECRIARPDPHPSPEAVKVSVILQDQTPMADSRHTSPLGHLDAMF